MLFHCASSLNKVGTTVDTLYSESGQKSSLYGISSLYREVSLYSEDF